MPKRLLVLLLFVFTGIQAFPQTRDAQLWTSFSMDKKLNKKFSLGLSEEFRFSDNISELGTYFFDLGLNYKLHKNWRIAANYRFTHKQRLDDSYSKRHRYYFDLSYRNKFDRFSFTLRGRFQSQYTDFNSSAAGHVPDYYTRIKLTVKYDLKKKLTPYLSSEEFIPSFAGEGILIDGLRLSAGIEYDLNKRTSLDFFYMIQKEYNVKNPETDFVIGLGYFHSF